MMSSVRGTPGWGGFTDSLDRVLRQGQKLPHGALFSYMETVETNC